MRYFDIPTIQQAIERLQEFSGNWLIPAFVLAANDVGTEEFVDISKALGTDQFLDRYFSGARLGIAPTPNGNNLLRPRLSDVKWKVGRFADDHMLRQDTKAWANLYSSRGYRDMLKERIIEGQRSIVRLTDNFQGRFEQEIPAGFRFEDFLIWLYAFEGFSDEIEGWDALFADLLGSHLSLGDFKPPYKGRFRLQEPRLEWPKLLSDRPSNVQFLSQLAPKLFVKLTSDAGSGEEEPGGAHGLPDLKPDDSVLATIEAAIVSHDSYAFLLAGPPGTGKTRYARQLANALTSKDEARTLFLQFHPAIAYDDFVQGFRPVKTDTGSGIRYDLSDRLFLDFADRAASDPESKYVAVIDELNRGDVARIFGEFLTYLEPDYRGVEFTLSMSGDRFAVPRNLILIATANPFDRSVTDLDDALLRRFLVIDFLPDGILLKSSLIEAGVDSAIVNRTMRLFEILNDALPTGFGHTSFLKVRSAADLVGVWTGRVRLSLRRAFLHDRETHDTIVAEIETLLTITDAAEQGDDIEAP